MKQKIIAVIGATGKQGTSVVNSLIQDGTFKVRALSRNPEKYTGQAHEVAKVDLTNITLLKEAFKDAYGVFVVTNFWEGADELAQGKAAIQAAEEAGINHFIWSTLPNVEQISNGQFEVPHFTGKAKVDELVKQAGFENYTFVQAPFYFQNFTGMMRPQPMEDGSMGWILPIGKDKRVIHMADISDLGKVVTGAFLSPEKVGKGSYLSLAVDLYSFSDVLAAYGQNGKSYSFSQVPGNVYSTFFPGAEEITQMLSYFEKHTYMGPGSDDRILLAREIATGPYTSFNEWIKQSEK